MERAKRFERIFLATDGSEQSQARMGDIGSLFLGSVWHDLLHVTDRPVLVAKRVPA